MEFKALVTDSNSNVRKEISRSLNEIGVRNVVEATNGDEALQRLEKDKFDVVFAEWNTQNSNGEDFVAAARKKNNKLPIIVTAPESKKINELKKQSPKASTFLTTPFTTEQLKKTVSEYAPSIAG
jgi:two-component system chemotaxis response regulator CheY